jgi:exopolyphosphatase / guanosine-5'-triphosphate,3'-diphosphate pyrophosphatase
MRLATIDLGSNTVRLLVADVEGAAPWRLVHQEQKVTRLGEGMSGTGALGDAPLARTASAVKEYVERARDLGATLVRIVATSAVREARNGEALRGRVERETGVPVEVVSGEDEARLTVRGVLEGLGSSASEWLVFDIGGGSTEYTLVRDGAIVASTSLRLGVVPLAERFPFPGPVDDERFRKMSREVAARLERELPAGLRSPTAGLVGTAGTVTTLAALDLGLVTYDAERVQGHRLDRMAIRRQLDRLAALTVGERGDLPCLEPGRADLIVPGVAIVIATMEHVGAETLLVSDWGLREGMLGEAIEALSI